MSVQQGMDSARIKAISGQIAAEVTKLGDVLERGNASASLLETNWGGDDGQQLLVRWRSEAAKQITDASEALNNAAKEMQRQAEQQDETSGQSGGGPGGPGGPGSPGGPGGPGGAGDPSKGPALSKEYKLGDRDHESTGVRTNTDEDGNKHHYDPVTGKTWVEAKDGTWREETSRTGHSSRTEISESDRGVERESTRGKGGGTREYGEKWSKESGPGAGEEDPKSVLDGVQSEPIVEKQLWDKNAEVAVAKGEVGDEKLGASGEVLSANAGTSGTAGISATDGAYVKANAEAGAYLAKGEAHWANEHGTSAQAEGYIGAEAAAEGTASIGPGGAKVEAGVEAFAGGKAEVGATQEIGDYGSVGAGAEVSYGIGAHANVDASLSADKIGFSADIGATLGIGAGVNIDVSVNPKEIISDVGEGISNVGEDIAESKLNPGNWW